MMVPEHVKVMSGKRLTFTTHSKYDMESLYEMTRVIDGNIRKDTLDQYYGEMYSSNVNVNEMNEIGYEKEWDSTGKYLQFVSFRLIYHKDDERIPEYSHKAELVMTVGYRVGELVFPIKFHYPVYRATVSKREENGLKLLDITYYDEYGNMTFHFIQKQTGSWCEIRSKAGEYILSTDLKKSKKNSVKGGCFYCDHAKYEKENGVIYIACDKYNGKIQETVYDGETYPEYCKRRA